VKLGLDPRRVATLVALVVALAVVVVVRLRPALLAGGARADARLPQVGRYAVPELGDAGAAARQAPVAGVGRNIFTFGPPPTPTPDPRPTPTPPPSLPPRPIVTPTPPGILLPSGERLAPPPRFSPAYLGWLGPQRLRVAVFRDGEEVLAVPEGATLKTSFVVRKVGVSEVVIGYVGYPENVTTKVQVSR